MPLLQNSDYISPFYMFSGHLETILPALFRKAGNVFYARERITTNDQDFLDLDWSKVGSRKLVLISHGLEGDSHSPYNLGMVKALNKVGWDALAWNYRGCSGELNKVCRFYHSGETKDLHFVLQHVVPQYDEIALIGFSIGGNITLKYLGEQHTSIHPKIRSAACFSVPCHLESGAMHLAKAANKVYLNRFLKSLKNKIRTKEAAMPGTFDLTDIDKISNFQEFDDKYTAPLNGFKNAKEYWNDSSSIFYIKNISIPTLLVNAKNDPFLTEKCYPIEEAKLNENFFLEIPTKGGHVGFFFHNKDYNFWSEKRAIEFIKNYF
jgi:hypothetical protein